MWGKVKEKLNTLDKSPDVNVPFTKNLRIWSTPKTEPLEQVTDEFTQRREQKIQEQDELARLRSAKEIDPVQQDFDQLYNDLNPEGKPVSDEEFDQLYNELNGEITAAEEELKMDSKSKALLNYLNTNPETPNRGKILTRLKELDPKAYESYISTLKDSEIISQEELENFQNYVKNNAIESQPETEKQPIGILESSEAREERKTQENIQKVKELFEKNPGEAMARIYATKGNFNSSKTGDDGGLFSYIGDDRLSSFTEVRTSEARKGVSEYIDQNVYYIKQNGIEKFKNKIDQDLAEEGDIYNPKKDDFVNVAQLAVDAVKKSFEYSINSSTRKQLDIISQLGI